MNPTSTIERLMAAVDEAVEAGALTIDAVALKSLLSQLAAIDGATQPQNQDEVSRRDALVQTHLVAFKQRLEEERQLRAVERSEDHTWNLEMFRSVLTYGQAALKSLFLLSGGAAVALLALLGHLVSNVPHSTAIKPIALAISLATWSLIEVTIAYCLSYVAQTLFAKSDRQPGNSWDRAGWITTAIVSLVVTAAIVTFVFSLRAANSAFVG